MKRRPAALQVSIFPFLSVLVCAMGVLAFLSTTLLLVGTPQPSITPTHSVTFQWVGAPYYVSPIFVRCEGDQVVYYNLFKNREETLDISQILLELQGKHHQFRNYLKEVANLNRTIKEQFGTQEHYPLLLVYPDGVLVSELLALLIEQVTDLNVGLEPMMPHWQVPYQSQAIPAGK